MRRFIVAGLIAGSALASAACAQAQQGIASNADATLSDLEIAAIQQACETVSIQYAHYLDGKDWQNLPNAFAPNGVWEVLSSRMEGPEQIREYWHSRTADWAPTHGRLHQISSQVIEVIDREHARGTSMVVVYFFDTAEGANEQLVPSLIAKNHDEFVRTADGWKIAHRRIERIADVHQ